MIDLKLSKKEKRQLTGTSPVAVGSNGPEYPFGTEINLETDQIKKLSLDEAEPGDMVRIEAIGKVIRLNINEKDKSQVTKSLSIQMQKMGIMIEETAKQKMRKEVAKEVFED